MRAVRIVIVLAAAVLLGLGCDASSGDAEGLHTSGPGDASAATYSDVYSAPESPDPNQGADAVEPAADVAEEPDEPEPEEFPPTNPFVMAAHDPQSTFAADVDTASYQIFVDRVTRNMLPSADTVRLEEFVNFFDYDYPEPDPEGDIPFLISLAAAPSPFREETTLLRVGIRGREVPEEEKKPANLVFLVDVSGSMTANNKLPLAKYLLKEAIDVLEPTDTISLVTYASSTGVRLQPTPVSERETIVEAIDGLNSGGSTAGAGGIQLAYEQAEAGFIEGGINHVLLCSDGDFNVGTSSTAGLVELIEEKRRTGITLTVLGFGYDNLNDSMIESITNAGNGVYAFIGNTDMASSFVFERLLSTMMYIAQDMKIQVEFNPALVLAYRLLGYENRAIPDQQFTDDTVDAGEVGAGHTVTALYELVFADGTVPLPEGAPAAEDGDSFDGELDVAGDELCLVKVRYKEVGATEDDPAFQVDEGLRSEDMSDLMEMADPDLQWAASVAALAEILKGSPYAEDLHLAVIEDLVASNCEGDADREELDALLPAVRELLDL